MINRLFRLILILLGLVAALALIALVVFRIINHTNGTIVSSGVTRRYLLYVPKSYDPATPTALVIAIHGFAEWPAHQMQISRWNNLADEEGFIVVYPAGLRFPMRWRAGASSSAAAPNEDVLFISNLIDKLEGEYNLDTKRIYANGLSNGGGMSFALACNLSDRIAAVGLVAGAYLLPWEECHPSRPVPAMIFHGTADPIVPFHGGPSRSFDLPFPDIPTWVAKLAQRNGCAETPETLPPSGKVSGVSYTGCAADVVFYTIEGGGHSWPGGEAIPKFIVGPTTQDIDATKLMWAFFKGHPLAGE